MPRLDGAMQSQTLGRGGFAFSGARIDRLEATEYTLATIAIDLSSSVVQFKNELEQMLRTAIDSCKKSARSDNIMIRVTVYSSRFARGVMELIGFTPLADLDLASIPALEPGGMTPLYDAAFEAIAATNAYAQKLRENDFGVNSILILITDGEDNASAMSASDVDREQKLAVSTEQLESHLSILVGINTQQCGPSLQRFKQDAGLDQYLDAGDATPQRLAKLAKFVSNSVSSQSQSLGTGGPSQNIAASI